MEEIRQFFHKFNTDRRSEEEKSNSRVSNSQNREQLQNCPSSERARPQIIPQESRDITNNTNIPQRGNNYNRIVSNTEDRGHHSDRNRSEKVPITSKNSIVYHTEDKEQHLDRNRSKQEKTRMITQQIRDNTYNKGFPQRGNSYNSIVSNTEDGERIDRNRSELKKTKITPKQSKDVTYNTNFPQRETNCNPIVSNTEEGEQRSRTNLLQRGNNYNSIVPNTEDRGQHFDHNRPKLEKTRITSEQNRDNTYNTSFPQRGNNYNHIISNTEDTGQRSERNRSERVPITSRDYFALFAEGGNKNSIASQTEDKEQFLRRGKNCNLIAPNTENRVQFSLPLNQNSQAKNMPYANSCKSFLKIKVLTFYLLDQICQICNQRTQTSNLIFSGISICQNCFIKKER